MPISEAPSSDDIKGRFPVPNPPKIEGLPTYESLTRLRKAQCQNAAAIEYGNSDSGCLGLVLDPNVYYLRYGNHFQRAVYPGLLPAYPANATDTERENIKHSHKLNLTAYEITERVETLLKTQIKNAIDDAYLTGIYDDTTAFGNRTILDIYQYLFNNYGTLSTTEIEQNKEKLKAPYDASQPLPTLFKRFEDCQALASAAGDPLSDKSLVNTAEHLLIATGQYHMAYRDWVQLPEVQKTYANLKIHFLKDFTLQNRMRSTTAAQHGYVNQITETDKFQEALNNLADATVADRTAFSDLTNTTDQLHEAMTIMSETNQSLQSQLTALQEQINKMSTTTPNPQPPPPTYYVPQPPPPPQVPQPAYPPNQQAYAPTYNPRGNQRQAGRGRGRGRGRNRDRNQRNPYTPNATQPTAPTNLTIPQPPTAMPTIPQPPPAPQLQPQPQYKYYRNLNYCFTHGFDVGNNHHSWTCNNPSHNHQWNATRDNTMGGSTKNQHLVLPPS